MDVLIGIIILLIIAILPVVLIGLFLHKKDKNKEPTKLLAKLFGGGIGSTFLTLFITYVLGIFLPFLFLESTKSNVVGLFFYIFFGVALVEEFSKWIFVYKISYKNKEFDEFYDIILYATFVALGFACLENILYVLQNGLGNGLLRAVTAVPGHVFDAVFMGYYLGLAKINSLNGRTEHYKKNLILSLLVPIITHGLYDYLIYTLSITGNLLFIILWLLLIIFLYIYCIKRVLKISKLTGNFTKIQENLNVNNNNYNNQNSNIN